MSKFIIALIATTFTMTAFADNHANHTMVDAPMVESAPTMARPAQAPKHRTKEIHAKKTQHYAKKAQYHTEKAQYHTQKAKHYTQKVKNHHTTTMPEVVVAMPVTN